MIGDFRFTVDLYPGPGTYSATPVGENDAFVLKLDSVGNFLWAKTFGGANYDVGYQLSIDAFGNIYTIGSFEGTADFDPGPGTYMLTSVGNYDIFVQKLDPNGNFLWAKAFGGTLQDESYSMEVAQGNVYITGGFSGTVDFDPGAGTYNITSKGGFDAFLQKMDLNGNFLWAKTFGGTGDDAAITLNVDNWGNVYTTGGFSGIVDFDPGAGTYNLISKGGFDVFVHKMSSCPATYKTDVVTACDSFVWIDGNTYTSSNNTATYVLTNAAGCDSIVTLNLTIDTVDVSVSQNGNTLTANETGASYQWIDCNNNNTPIPGTQNQSFTPTSDGSYAVIVDNGNCSDTSKCISVTITQIGYNPFEETIRVFPNPTKNEFFINLGTPYENIKVTIKDILGNVVQMNTFHSRSKLLLSLNKEAAGFYFVEIEAQKKKAIIKLIKE